VASKGYRRETIGSVIENGVLVVLAAIGLVALTVVLRYWTGARVWLLAEHPEGIDTIAQVVPATVVAVFVFALGAVFVIAQIVIPSRGTRSVSELLRYVRMRLVLAVGVGLLVGSLFVTTGGHGDLNQWRAALAAALLIASGLYILLATAFLAWSLVGQISPRSFKERLVLRPRRWGLAPWRQKSWDAENLFWTLRVFRGWIRTVNRIGESRDLHFALDGLLHLVRDYVNDAREEPAIRTAEPSDYSTAKKSRIGAISEDEFNEPPEATSGATKIRTDPSNQGQDLPDQKPTDLDTYWFASELGRALTRAVESGVRGNTLRRDLDRLLNLFDRSIFAMAPRPDQSSGAVLVPETRIILKQLTEAGLGVRQCDEAVRNWYAAPALRLARQVNHLRVVQQKRAHENECSPKCEWGNLCKCEWKNPCSLPCWALAGWLMVTDAYLAQHSTRYVKYEDDELADVFIERSSEWLESLTQDDWEEAKIIAKSNKVLEPAWDVIVDRAARAQRIDRLASLASASSRTEQDREQR
jgi:hypothetical protein